MQTTTGVVSIAVDTPAVGSAPLSPAWCLASRSQRPSPGVLANGPFPAYALANALGDHANLRKSAYVIRWNTTTALHLSVHEYRQESMAVSVVVKVNVARYQPGKAQ